MGERPMPASSDTRADALPGPALRRATAADAHRLKTVLAEAFYEDPVLSWLLPDQRSREARLRRFFAIELRYLGLPHGHVWTTEDLSGTAISLPASAWHPPLRAVLLEGRLFGAQLPRATRLQLATDRRHLREPHHYFRDIGVLPEAQGRGLGSALMRPTLERCDREGLPAYLEASSERSAALYERLGFRVTEELRIGGSPPLWLMLREPHGNGRSA
jgi:ribosomal protein S18 acetylase RimI-like enzyme